MHSLISSCAFFLLITSPFTILFTSRAQKVCSRPIGSNISLDFTASSDYRFYLNTANPASCNGTVSTFDYCYYGPSKYRRNVDYYRATMALYRPSNEPGRSYVKVSDTTTISKESDASSEERIQLEFNCDSYAFSHSIHVQEGDVIGTCIFNAGFRSNPLILVGENTSSGYLMMYQDAQTAGCTTDALPDVVNGITMDDVPKVMHISAQITPYPSITPTASNENSVIVKSSSTSIMCRQSMDEMCSSIVTLASTRTKKITRSASASVNNLPSTSRRDVIETSDHTLRIIELYKTVVSNEMSTLRKLLTATSVIQSPVSNVELFSFKTILDNHNTPQETATVADLEMASMIAQTTENLIGKTEGSTGLVYVTGIVVGLFVVVLVIVLVLAATVIMRKRRNRASSKPLLVNAIFGLHSINVSRSQETTQEQAVALDDYDFIKNQYATIDSSTNFTNGEDGGDHIYHILEGPQYPYSELLEKNKTEDIYEEVAMFHEPANEEDSLYTQIKSFGINNINRSSIQIYGHLGSGQFGHVKRGVWKIGRIEFAVALKALSEGSTLECRVKFLQEAAIMAQFRHSNIVSLYGVISKDEPMMLVAELAEKGDLGNHLTSLRPSSTTDETSGDQLPSLLLKFSEQVALGMYYLSSKGFVHRDLAARNILVSKKDICKIADFGMSRDLADENYYISKGGEVPVKWTAPEAIHYKKYSSASDVWSYGCLLYEIWSLGHTPFEDIDPLEVINKIESGIRLAPPPGCPKTVYELMIQCWHPKTSGRPRFRDIFLKLTDKEEKVLSLPSRGPESSLTLGSSLECGEHLYKDLQEKYLISNVAL